MRDYPESISATADLLAGVDYFAPRPLATALFLSLKMGKPLLLEGEAGVGKTALAQAAARALGRKLIRLQCYEGLDSAAALYDWDYPRQLLALRASGDGGGEVRANSVYTREFLLPRPLLRALEEHENGAPVLLIDELDRADEPFEAFLLEFLADFAVTVPELGAIKAPQAPVVFLTSNRTREIHDAVKRRCLYHWLDFPSRERETQIVRKLAPQLGDELTTAAVAFVRKLREMDLFKLPGIAETLDWAQALAHLQTQTLDENTLRQTLGALLKYQDDLQTVERANLAEMLSPPSPN